MPEMQAIAANVPVAWWVFQSVTHLLPAKMAEHGSRFYSGWPSG